MAADAPAGDLLLFAYGTLKEGFENHARFCSGARPAVRGWVHGRLHAWTDDIPILAVPPESILFTGGHDARLDLESAPLGPVGEPASVTGDWRRIEGELIALPGAEARLRVLDALEGFHPRAPGHYLRVLVPVHVASGAVIAAWAYIAPPERPPRRPALDVDAWQ